MEKINLENFKSTIYDTAIQHKAVLDSYAKEIAEYKDYINKKSTELNRLNDFYSNLNYSCNYLDTLIKNESDKFIKELNSILDYGIKTIFDDCDYSILIKVEDNNKATIHLVYEDEDGNKIEPDIKNCGGGIQTVCGILLQVFFIYHYNVEHIIFIDEGLSQISSQYIGNTFALLKELAKKNDLKILLITHDNRFLPYSDKQYQIKNGKAYIVNAGDIDTEDGDGINDTK